jgi:putative hemolysin
MKKGLVIVIALFTAACSSNTGEWGMFGKNAPRTISGTDSRVVLYDANGVDKNAGQTAATKYCANYGKIAEFQSRGGDSSDCVSSQLNYCVTYSCK